MATGSSAPTAPALGVVRTMVVDDQEVVRRGLVALLAEHSDLEVVAEAATAQQALQRARSARPDVVVLEVRLPDRSGIEVCRLLRVEHANVAVVIFTALSDDRALFDSILAGAAAFILKSAPGAHLVDAVRRASAGESLLDADTAAAVLERLGRTPAQEDSRLRSLNPVELRMLRMISQGLTNREIARRVQLSDKTVKKYVSRILSKLGVSRRAEAAAYLAGASREIHGVGPPHGDARRALLWELVRSLHHLRGDLVPEAMVELGAALEEQQVIETELRSQNQQLESARNALETQLQHYADLYDRAPIAYLVTDPVGLIRQANRAAARLLGSPVERLAGKPLAAFVAPHASRAFRRRLTAAGAPESGSARGGEPGEAWTVELKDGDAPLPVSVAVGAARDDHGSVSALRWLLWAPPGPHGATSA